MLTAKDIAYRINESQAKAVIVSPMHVEKVNKIVDECPSLKYLIVTGRASGDWLSFETICEEQDSELSSADLSPFLSHEIRKETNLQSSILNLALHKLSQKKANHLRLYQ